MPAVTRSYSKANVGGLEQLFVIWNIHTEIPHVLIAVEHQILEA